MKKILTLPKLISSITGRKDSLFKQDVADNAALIKNKIDGKSILVIGGAGTIGSSFIQSLLKNGAPKELIVLDINENGLTELVRDIRSSSGLHIPQEILTYPINFGDPVAQKILADHGRFDIVANFAAHKHVRSEKDKYAIEAMIDNNVIKAKNLLDILLKAPPEYFFCVSTDKAANPVNIMGASKKIMEDIILSYAGKMHISTARFANVVFSNGSLPFGFVERLMKQQPLSAPSNIKRFFVSPEESGELCMLACLLSDSGDIFFPKLNPEKDMHTFTFIAEKLLAEFDLIPDICASEEEARIKASMFNESSNRYPVFYFDSDTSGEKPFEEFCTAEENPILDKFEQLGIIKDKLDRKIENVLSICERIKELFLSPDITKADIVKLLDNYLPNFNHIEKGKSLDQRM